MTEDEVRITPWRKEISLGTKGYNNPIRNLHYQSLQLESTIHLL